MHAPLYERILAGLSGHIDPLVFERCMGDLLRDAFPGLVPVPGGNDAGMDAAIADGEGEPFPLVCTTAKEFKDTKRNLLNSLDSYARRLTSRKVALATPRPLTPAQRFKLRDAARERGFHFVQLPIEQQAIADRLYRDSRWRKELLGISGDPPALSVVPLTRRPLMNLRPVGREADIQWVKATRGDRVLVGEPGSGKTFLLYHLMRKRWSGLFVASSNTEAIADAIRDLRPKVLVVDDAHANPARLAELIQLRRQISATFSILATTWLGARDQVVEALGVGSPQIHRLELLARKDILDIIEQVGVRKDADVLRELADQAANKPGLAVTIASLWLQGSWQEVADGSVLRRTLLSFFGDFVGPQSAQVLGAFALAGARGMALEVVADELGLDLAEIHRIAAGLAAGGVLSEVDEGVLAVGPRALRSALIREVFFPRTAPKLPFEGLLARVPSIASAVEALVVAKAYKANIPTQLLRHLVAQADSRRAWEGLAGLGEDDAVWVLERYGGDVLDVARAALDAAPRATIPRLLARATTSGSGGAWAADPMATLTWWVREIRISDDEKLTRRRLLARLSAEFLRQGGEPGVGIHGICLALSPGVEGTQLDPGGNTITESSGLLRLPQLREIEAVWDEARAALDELDAPSWQHLKGALWSWIYPQYAARSTNVSEETTRFMHGFATKVLRELVPLVAGHPGLVSGLRELAGRLGVALVLEADPDFDILFPPGGESVDDATQDAARIALEGLAAKWVVAGPREVAQKLVEYEQEAQRAGRQWSSKKGALGRALAEAAQEPTAWLDALLEAGASDLVVQPFLMRVAHERREGCERFLERTLAREQYAWAASEVTLQLENPPVASLKRALELAVRAPQLVETLCLRRKVPVATLHALLLHSSTSIALAAAVGEWHAGGRAAVRQEIAEAWRGAVLRAPGGEQNIGPQFWLGVILASDSGLAADWLSARLGEVEERHLVSEDGPFGHAVSALDRAQRLWFLKEHENLPFPPDLVRLLVGREAEVYRHLLSLRGLAERHLEPLEGMPDEAWLELAVLALGAGYDPRDIAEASLSTSHTTVGSGLAYWGTWDEAFARFEQDRREDVREVGRQGRGLVAPHKEHAETLEREFALHGVAGWLG